MTIILSQYVSLTNIKIFIAKILFRFISFFFKNYEVEVKRNGINYRLDLSEGVDLSVFLFGKFQDHVTKLAKQKFKKGAVIFDVGANIGHMTLSFAKELPESKVYSFEPTNFAFEKLKRNLELNADLKSRINLNKVLVSDKEGEPVTLSLFSSWSLLPSKSKKHDVHGGVAKEATATPFITLDGFAKKEGLSTVDLIKVDTDGHELEVLRGAIEVLKKFRPMVVFEMGLYLIHEKKLDFVDFQKFFYDLGYEIYDMEFKTKLTSNNYKSFVPKFGTTDLIAVPKGYR